MFDVEVIKNKFRKYTNNQYLIEELTQLALIRLSKYSYKNYNDNQVKKLINLIIKSVYVDFYRHDKTEIKPLSILELSQIDFNKLIKSINEEPKINIDHLVSALDKLSQVQREVILLRFYFKLKYIEIGKILNCSKNTALSHFHKAKFKLREYLTTKELYG